MITYFTDHIEVSTNSNYPNYEKYYTLYVITDKQGNCIQSVLNNHCENDCIELILNDGYYIIYKFIIPDSRCLDSTDPSITNFSNFIVIKNNAVYLFKNNTLQSITYQELLNLKDTNMKIDIERVFIYLNLLKCIKLYLFAYNDEIQIKDNNLPDCNDCKNLTDKDQLFKRLTLLKDFLTMIQNLVKCRKYLEANKLLNLINYCNVSVRRKDSLAIY